MMNEKMIECDTCGGEVDTDDRHAFYKEYRDGSTKACCGDCGRTASKRADAHADP